MIRIRPLLLLLILVSLSACRVQNVRIKQTGTAVVLQNGKASFSFDLSSGTYSIRNLADRTEVVSHAKLGINEWTSDDPGFKRSWDQHDVSDHFGSGTALDLRLQKDSGIVLHFTFILYEDQDFISAGGGITNSTDQSLQVKSIHVMEEGQLYEGLDKTRDFAMVDGFSGGEPLEYGRRFYSPLTRRNALKSRNNILLTFTGEGKRRSLVMGGLTYHDFEKFAAIEQPRRVELERGADGISSLVCYLDLPAGKADRGPGGEVLELVKGAGSRRWQYHEFHCTETATSVMEPGEVIVEARNIRTDGAYTLGISWWYGLWHGDHPDLYQSVFVEFERDGVTQKLPLLEYHPLPRFDGVKKMDAEQVELALPAQAVLAGKFRVIVEKSTSPAEAGPVQPSDEVADQNVYLSEIWLRDGTSEPFLPGTPTQVKDSPHPRRSYKARLYGMDPVGKRVDPGQTYMAPDLFYMNAAEPDPFLALEEYGMSVRTAQEIDLAMYDFPTVCLWYAENSYYGGSSAENTTQGAVEEMERIAESGFLKYSRAAVRLVPDSYMPDNQQGWWDDAHWRREDTDLNASKNGR
ncbi:MAG: hypothetical protein EHM46_04335, partial [Bacteroidetes bacterium]